MGKWQRIVCAMDQNYIYIFCPKKPTETVQPIRSFDDVTSWQLYFLAAACLLGRENNSLRPTRRQGKRQILQCIYETNLQLIAIQLSSSQFRNMKSHTGFFDKKKFETLISLELQFQEHRKSVSHFDQCRHKIGKSLKRWCLMSFNCRVK